MNAREPIDPSKPPALNSHERALARARDRQRIKHRAVTRAKLRGRRPAVRWPHRGDS